ncbi:DUF4837 family protein [Saprospira sp. CCB-QB6]|uniref:DUF4837 family protein n=1 Tax=Saprospira sp. CCB-QB6 TaxID=3023936 RepID=UPI00234A12AE|nr:DUF4837 family protein [Saprospira sp. CCB-QB6]WCL83029.1 DUF4837 family protein [Saprospira sp. CCB-QB6]
MRIFYFLSLLSLPLFLLSSCSQDQLKRLEVTPTAYGSVDQMYFVCDEYLWDKSPIGDSVRQYFEALYPITPQPEPILDLRHVESREFNKVLKTHRSIVILVDLSDEDEAGTDLVRQALGDKKVQKAFSDPTYRIAVQRDRWAKDQTVIFWFAPDRQSLFETVCRDYQKVINILHEKDTEKLVKQIYFSGQSEEIEADISKGLDLSISVPKGYKIAHQDSVACWLRKETNKVSSNIFIYSIENPAANTLSPDSLKAIRNRLTKDYFSSWQEGSYMQIDDVNLPTYYEKIDFGQREALQARGIWFMANDFMGGPFVTYLIPDPDNNRIILLDGFIHAPGQKKRPEMRKLDVIFSTFALKTKK